MLLTSITSHPFPGGLWGSFEIMLVSLWIIKIIRVPITEQYSSSYNSCLNFDTLFYSFPELGRWLLLPDPRFLCCLLETWNSHSQTNTDKKIAFQINSDKRGFPGCKSTLHLVCVWCVCIRMCTCSYGCVHKCVKARWLPWPFSTFSLETGSPHWSWSSSLWL